MPGVTAGASYFSLQKQVGTRRLNTESLGALHGSGGCEDELVAGETTGKG